MCYMNDKVETAIEKVLREFRRSQGKLVSETKRTKTVDTNIIEELLEEDDEQISARVD